MAVGNKKQSLSWDGLTLVVAYGHGVTRRFDCGLLPAAIFTDTAAARHGIAQKIGDAKSGGTSREKCEEADAIWANMLGGDWNRKGEQGGVEALMPAVFLVLAAGDKKKAEAWVAKWAALGDEGKETVLAKPDVKAALTKVKAERKLAGLENTEADPFTM